MRAQILVLEAAAAAVVRELDTNVTGVPIEEYEAALEPHLRKWDEIRAMREELVLIRPFPIGDSCQIELDEPIFGLHNWPDPDQFLYHYTNASTLSKIRESSSILFRALANMNDAQEALFSLAYQTGLMGPPGLPLSLTVEEAQSL